MTADGTLCAAGVDALAPGTDWSPTSKHRRSMDNTANTDASAVSANTESGQAGTTEAEV